MNQPYDDIINLSRPVSVKHPRMGMIGRAAQFSPFQALSGYGAALQETARLTDQKIELTEDEQLLLDEKLRRLSDTGADAEFTWFRPDLKKSGGAYVTTNGRIKRLDSIQRVVLLESGNIIPIEDILEIETEPVSIDQL